MTDIEKKALAQMTEPSEAPKPCPFCGGAAQLVCGGPGLYYIRCEGCAASTDDGGRIRAITAWNTRAMVAGEPVAWLYEGGRDGPFARVSAQWPAAICRAQGWTETPLYAHPAPDTAALVSALGDNAQGWENAIELRLLPERHHDTARRLADDARALIAQHKGT
ncbi:MAG: Lar family restriction alleviation protein [Fluviibacter sp.]